MSERFPYRPADDAAFLSWRLRKAARKPGAVTDAHVRAFGAHAERVAHDARQAEPCPPSTEPKSLAQ